MAHKCKANDADPWMSRINNVSEGDITINTEGSDGRFDGKHKDTDNHLQGRCFEAGSDVSDRIWFVVPDNDHLYFGVIHPNGKRIDGTRFQLSRLLDSKRAKLLDGDEDWVATKT